MTKSCFKADNLLPLLVLAGSLVLFNFGSMDKQTGDIVLHNEQLSITPLKFYVANVIDHRADRSAVAALISAGNEQKSYTVDLQGGFSAIKQFIDQSLPKDVNRYPVVISINKCFVTETAASPGSVKGHVIISMSCGLRHNDQVVHLLDYNGTATYERTPGPPQEIEPTLRHVLENGLVYFNTWVQKHAPADIRLAKALTVTFTDYTEVPEGDTIYYSSKRPLTWDDFKSTISSGRFDAEVYPSFGYNESTAVKDAVIRIRIDLKAFLPKSAASVRDGSRDSYTLNHEQRHFDIAEIIARRFKRKIMSETLPLDNYDGQINVDYLDAYREMDSLQMRYDRETSHGSDRFAQEQWNKKIDAELTSPAGLTH